MEGYIKPHIQQLKVYDRQKDRAKTFGKRVEMHLLQFLASALKNHATQQVATVTRLSGSTSNPKFNEWETIRKLIGNGFARAILPGFLAKPRVVEPP